MEGWASSPELAGEMPALIVELTTGRGEADLATHGHELPRVERVAASGGLSVHGYEVAVDGGKRCRVLAEPLKLGVVAIAERAAPQDFACKQSLTPQRDQALRVEVLRMQRPESQFLLRRCLTDRALSCGARREPPLRLPRSDASEATTLATARRGPGSCSALLGGARSGENIVSA